MHTKQLAVVGADGRMGKAVGEIAESDPEVVVGAWIEAGDSLTKILETTHCTIEFALADVTPATARACSEAGVPLVIGTTGHDAGQRATIEACAKAIPIVWAPNFSVGVNTLFWLTRKAAEILGPDFDLEVIESHHRLKKDAPSGTARRLAEILTEVRELSYEKATRHGRHGIVGERTDEEIGVHAIRGGDIVGEHTVLFAGNGERVELTHRASSRLTFAAGAVRAAKWVIEKPPGLYDMQDVLGLGD